MFEPYILYLSSKLAGASVNKQAGKVLRSVYGLGLFRSYKFIVFSGANKNRNIKISNLSPKFFKRIQFFSFRSGYVFGIYLKKRRVSVRRFLINLKTRKGLRQFYGLPSRGQRSHSNAATAKKKLLVSKV